jgi:formate-nitrite transporter family protein
MKSVDGEDLDVEQKRQVRQRRPASADVLHAVTRTDGENELARSSRALGWSGLAGGLSMGFSLVAEGILRTDLPDAPWRPLVSKLGYAVGFLIVILGRQQLFTENTLSPILPLLHDRSAATARNVLRLWAIVLVTNLAGALAFATVVGRTALFEPDVRATFAALGREAMAPAASLLFERAILAGWLIALIVWILPSVESAKVWIIVLLAYLVGIGRFPHIVAGSVETMYVVVIGGASWMAYVVHYALPTLAGNVLGGVSFVTLLNHAQVVATDSDA